MKGVVRVDQLTGLLGVSRTTLYRWERAGDFPTRRKIGPNVVGWLEEDIEEWLDSRPVDEDAA